VAQPISAIAQRFAAIPLNSGVENIPDSLRLCYGELLLFVPTAR
jgi:hypothetical protein